MGEINAREEELGKMRSQIISHQDEAKMLTVSREQCRSQSEALQQQMKKKDLQLQKFQKLNEEQSDMIENLCTAQKNLNMSSSMFQGEAIDKAREEIERAQRIAKSTSGGSFMNLGDKDRRLASEQNIGSLGS